MTHSTFKLTLPHTKGCYSLPTQSLPQLGLNIRAVANVPKGRIKQISAKRMGDSGRPLKMFHRPASDILLVRLNVACE